jgi:hypothetical protein
MDPIVGLVAVVGLEVHGRRAIGRYTEAIDQLLEIGTALLIVPALELNGLAMLTIIGLPWHCWSSASGSPRPRFKPCNPARMRQSERSTRRGSRSLAAYQRWRALAAPWREPPPQA